jgi:hypothetical protein
MEASKRLMNIQQRYKQDEDEKDNDNWKSPGIRKFNQTNDKETLNFFQPDYRHKLLQKNYEGNEDYILKFMKFSKKLDIGLEVMKQQKQLQL